MLVVYVFFCYYLIDYYFLRGVNYGKCLVFYDFIENNIFFDN